jgi:hypothetical protein
MERRDVYAAIDSERDYQVKKWGTNEQRPKQVGAWLTLMRAILFRAENAWAFVDGDYEALEEVRKLTAVGVSCMEQHGCERREG